MKSLRVLLVGKNTPAFFNRDNRNMGMWSYPVEQFTWEHCAPGKGFVLNRHSLSKGFDLIFHEDGGSYGDYIGGGIPVIYYAIDSTLSHENHYLPRFKQSVQADLVLVDHDHLKRWRHPDKRNPRRLLYCVNDKVFTGEAESRDLDIVYHCPGGKWVPGKEERRHIRQLLHEYSQERGLTYVSGAVDLNTYANHFARAKIVVSWSRTDSNRPHRVYDSMASGACLVSRKLPQVSGEDWSPYYNAFDTPGDLCYLLDNIWWDASRGNMAVAAQQFVRSHHTWAHRAKELRQIIYEEFKL